jgi:DNA-binding protein HU-beta
MHRNAFIRAVAREAGATQAEVGRILDAALRVIARSLARGERVVLTGFGALEMRQRAARRGVDPRTGQAISLGVTRSPGFTASARLKAATSGQAARASAQRSSAGENSKKSR